MPRMLVFTIAALAWPMADSSLGSPGLMPLLVPLMLALTALSESAWPGTVSWFTLGLLIGSFIMGCGLVLLMLRQSRSRALMQLAGPAPDFQMLRSEAQMRAVARVRDIAQPSPPHQPGLPGQQSHKVLLLPLFGRLDAASLQLVREQALQALDCWTTIRLVLDITGVQAIDPVIAQQMMSFSRAMQPLGAEVILAATSSGAGKQPVRVLLDLHAVASHHDLEMAFNLMIRRR